MQDFWLHIIHLFSFSFSPLMCLLYGESTSIWTVAFVKEDMSRQKRGRINQSLKKNWAINMCFPEIPTALPHLQLIYVIGSHLTNFKSHFFSQLKINFNTYQVNETYKIVICLGVKEMSHRLLMKQDLETHWKMIL